MSDRLLVMEVNMPRSRTPKDALAELVKLFSGPPSRVGKTFGSIVDTTRSCFQMGLSGLPGTRSAPNWTRSSPK
jgi:hypothetical protein